MTYFSKSIKSIKNIKKLILYFVYNINNMSNGEIVMFRIFKRQRFLTFLIFFFYVYKLKPLQKKQQKNLNRGDGTFKALNDDMLNFSKQALVNLNIKTSRENQKKLTFLHDHFFSKDEILNQ